MERYKNIIQIKDKSDSLPTCLSDDGSSITDPSLIANHFNSYFSSIGKTLQSKIHSSHIDFFKYLKNPNINSFLFLLPIAMKSTILYQV